MQSENVAPKTQVPRFGHRHCLAIPGGRWLGVDFFSPNVLAVFDPATAELRQWPTPHACAITCIRLLPDGWLVTGDEQGLATLHAVSKNWANLAPVAAFVPPQAAGHTPAGAVKAIAGTGLNRIAVLHHGPGEQNRLIVWDGAVANILTETDPLQEECTSIETLSPDGTGFVCSMIRARAEVVRKECWLEVRRFAGLGTTRVPGDCWVYHRRWPVETLTPDSTGLLTIGGKQERGLTRWNVARPTNGHASVDWQSDDIGDLFSGSIYRVACSADGNWAATLDDTEDFGFNASHLTLLDLRSGEVRGRITNCREVIERTAFNLDSAGLALTCPHHGLIEFPIKSLLERGPDQPLFL